MPFLSIVIANYNYGRFLEEAIQSVVTQDGFDQCELIVVDGGSSDNSVEVIKKYADQIAWWCSEKDNGQSDAFNKGFDHARGRLGCWVNADDVLLPGALKKVLEFIDKHPETTWIGGGTVWLNKDLSIKKCSANVRMPDLLQTICPGYIVGGPSSFFRISALRELGGFDTGLHYAMDNDLWLRMLASGRRLDVMRGYVWTFRIHQHSKTSMNLGPHDESALPLARLVDRDALLRRYPKAMKHQKLVSKVIMVIKLLKGAYWKSFIDTLCYSGKNVFEVFK